MKPLLDSALDGSDPFAGTKLKSLGLLGKRGTRASSLSGHTRSVELRDRGEVPCVEAGG